MPCDPLVSGESRAGRQARDTPSSRRKAGYRSGGSIYLGSLWYDHWKGRREAATSVAHLGEQPQGGKQSELPTQKNSRAPSQCSRDYSAREAVEEDFMGQERKVKTKYKYYFKTFLL